MDSSPARQADNKAPSVHYQSPIPQIEARSETKLDLLARATWEAALFQKSPGSVVQWSFDSHIWQFPQAAFDIGTSSSFRIL
jgi:hypothetical protein